jgi:hypothetical protein
MAKAKVKKLMCQFGCFGVVKHVHAEEADDDGEGETDARR